MVNNVTGWNELYSGDLIGASYIVFNTALMGWVVTLLFIVFWFMLIIKTRSLTLSATTLLIFLAGFAGSVYLTDISQTILFMILAIEVCAILYLSFNKK